MIATSIPGWADPAAWWPKGPPRPGRYRSCIRGFTLLELIVVIAIVATLGAYFLDRALQNMETAERVAMEAQARAVGAALNLQLAALIARGRGEDIPRLATTNPVDWLVERPANYIGERDRPPGADEAAGSWYFDLGTRELVYVVRRGERFEPDSAGRKQVRYRVRLVHDPSAPPGGDVVGAVFQPVHPYRWTG